MEKKILAFGIENEFEDGPLWFDLSDSVTLVAYLISNIDLNEKREFTIKEFTQKEFDELE